MKKEKKQSRWKSMRCLVSSCSTELKPNNLQQPNIQTHTFRKANKQNMKKVRKPEHKQKNNQRQESNLNQNHFF